MSGFGICQEFFMFIEMWVSEGIYSEVMSLENIPQVVAPKNQRHTMTKIKNFNYQLPKHAHNSTGLDCTQTHTHARKKAL
jgi:hypothetical protein